MRTEVSQSTPFAVVHGSVWPREDGRVDVPALTEHLRRHGVVAALGSAPARDAPDTTVALALLVHGSADEAPRAALMGAGPDGAPSGPVAGPWAHDVVVGIVEALEVNVELGGVWWDETDLPAYEPSTGATEVMAGDAVDEAAYVADDAEPDLEPDDLDEGPGPDHPGDVLLCRQAESSLPVLARGLGSGLTAFHVDGWTLVHLDDAWLDPASEGWLPFELPVVQLKRSDEETRVVEVFTRAMQTESILLRRHRDLDPLVDPEVLAQTLGPDVAASLTNPHLAPDSPMREVLSSKHFAAVDPYLLASALQTPMDERWTARVLATLGLPAVAGDVHEGRTVPAGGTRIEARTMGRAMGEMVLRYYDAPAYEVARRTLYGRAYAALSRTPVRAATTVVAEATLAGVLGWATGFTDSRALKLLCGAGAVFVAADALTHAVLAPQKFRRS